MAGYLALNDNQLDEAEKYWEQLNQINPQFGPADKANQKWTARYYYSLTLYRKSMEIMNKDLDTGTEILSKVGALGALDQQVADALIRVHLYRFAQLARQEKWQEAGQEVELASSKLDSLSSDTLDNDTINKLTAFCLASQGLIHFRKESYSRALENFGEAAETIKTLHQENPWDGQGGSLLEDMLRRLMKEQEFKNQIDLRFPRDIQYLSAVMLLYLANENATAGKADKYLAQGRKHLEAAVGSSPNFVEGRMLLGLIFYYTARDENERRKGIEALQSIREHTASKFILATLNKFDEDQNRMQDARKAYFDLLQSYLHSTNVPMAERETLRKDFLEQMQLSGEYQALLGTGSLDVKNEKDPTVNEFIQRSALLRTKIQQILETQSSLQVSPQISTLIEQLNLHNRELQKTVDNITNLEMQILQESKGLF